MSVLLFAAALAVATPVQAGGMHTYQSVAIAPEADRVAAIEGVDPLDSMRDAHSTIVIRSAKTGAVLQTIDPCKTCRYGGLTWSPKGDALAFVVTDRKAGTAAIDIAVKGAVKTATTLKGAAETIRWSPDGAALAFLAVVGAHKEVGATQAGV
ncbi:hypothetical protein ACNJUT_21120, partial [Mycobacterium tuberculosis]